jgi:lysophospholipase L1-like esterase
MQPITFVVVIVVVIVSSWWYFHRDYNYIDKPRGGENIIAFGDSLTAGAGATAGNDYVSVLSRRIGQPIINAGVAGDTTELAMERFQADVLDKNPRIVILELGGNDGLQKQPIDGVFGRLATMIQRIHQSGAAVLLIGIKPQLFSQEYNSRFEDLAREENTSFVPDILHGIVGHDDLMADTIHPNDKGNVIMADRIEPVLRKMLR